MAIPVSRFNFSDTVLYRESNLLPKALLQLIDNFFAQAYPPMPNT